MQRGTGTVSFQGEEADYALCFCLACGNVGIEEWNHLPAEKRLEATPPPKIVLENVVVKGHGRSMTIKIDYRYGDDVTITEGNEILPPTIEHATRNSTTLSMGEAAALSLMSAKERREYLLELGEREWYAREEQRIMKTVASEMQAKMEGLVGEFVGADLLKEKGD